MAEYVTLKRALSRLIARMAYRMHK